MASHQISFEHSYIADDEWILVAGGMSQITPSTASYTNYTQLFNIKTGQACFLESLPFNYIYNVHGVLFQGVPTLCGGSFNSSVNLTIESNPYCFMLKQGSWIKVRNASCKDNLTWKSFSKLILQL